jgi:phosphopantothenoylcysteine decarboxylase/phosphopantothenate--cysteine ligase
MLKERRIFGVTGGIAAYKAAELVRELAGRGAQVRVIMTDHAREFIAPLTFETLSGNPVAGELFRLNKSFEIDHIALAQFAELIVIAPATANVIGKMAAGIADDLLTTVLVAATASTLICPAMNDKMYANPVVKENLARLVARGHTVLEPGYGELACRTEGQGRLPDAPEMPRRSKRFSQKGSLERIPHGMTHAEPFDPSLHRQLLLRENGLPWQ